MNTGHHLGDHEARNLGMTDCNNDSDELSYDELAVISAGNKASPILMLNCATGAHIPRTPILYARG